MAFSIDIGRIRHQSYRIIRQDGLSDICGGLMLGIMAVFFYDFRYAGALILGCAMQTIVLPLCRRKITYPRIGFARFPRRPDTKSMLLWDIILPLAVVSMIVFIGIWARQLLPASLGVFLAALALAGARTTGYTLDYLAAMIFLLAGITGQLFVWRGSGSGIVSAFLLWSLAIIMIPVGVVQLIRFMQKYKIPSGESLDGAE